MRITDIKCAVIGDSPIIRIVTDEGIDGWGQIESSKPYAGVQLPFFKPLILDMGPTRWTWADWPRSSGWPSTPTCTAFRSRPTASSTG